MTTNYQKRIEEFYALQLAKLLNENWEVKSPPDELLWPDLSVSYNGQEFGLEIREVYSDETRKGSIKRRAESSNIKKIKMISDKYYEASSVPIMVKFFGCIKDVDRIIFCIRDIGELGDFQQVRINPYLGSSILLTKLPDSITNYSRWFYMPDRVGAGSKIDISVIDSIISEKSDKLSKYSTNYDDVRLLLICNSLFNSGGFKIPDVSELKAKGFSKVYILKYPDGLSVIGS